MQLYVYVDLSTRHFVSCSPWFWAWPRWCRPITRNWNILTFSSLMQVCCVLHPHAPTLRYFPVLCRSKMSSACFNFWDQTPGCNTPCSDRPGVRILEQSWFCWDDFNPIQSMWHIKLNWLSSINPLLRSIKLYHLQLETKVSPFPTLKIKCNFPLRRTAPFMQATDVHLIQPTPRIFNPSKSS